MTTLYKYHEGKIYTTQINHSNINNFTRYINLSKVYDKILEECSYSKLLKDDRVIWKDFVEYFIEDYHYCTLRLPFHNKVMRDSRFYIDFPIPKYLNNTVYSILEEIGYDNISDVALYTLMYYNKKPKAVKEFLSRHFNNIIPKPKSIKCNETEPKYEITTDSIIFNLYKRTTKRIEITFSNDIDVFINSNETLYNILNSLSECTERNAIESMLRSGKIIEYTDMVTDILMTCGVFNESILSILHSGKLLPPTKTYYNPPMLEMYLTYDLKDKYKVIRDSEGNKQTTKHAIYSLLTSIYPNNLEYKRQLDSVVIDKTKFIEREDDYIQPLLDLIRKENITPVNHKTGISLIRRLCKTKV